MKQSKKEKRKMKQKEEKKIIKWTKTLTWTFLSASDTTSPMQQHIFLIQTLITISSP